MVASEKQLPRLKKKTCWWQEHPHRQPFNLGQFGEDRAISFLQKNGFQVIDRNVRIGNGEIDVVVWDQNTQELVFVEVKTRHQVYSGDPSFAVDRRKLRALLRAVQAYLKEIWRKQTGFRVDVLSISPGKIRHTPNITWGMLK